MPSDKERLTLIGSIETFLTPNPNVKDTASRQQARFTTLVSLIFGAVCLISAIGALIAGLTAGLIISLFFLTIGLAVAFAFGRTENYQVGSIIMVCGIILAGFSVSASVHNTLTAALVLLVAVVSALSISIILLPLVAISIISVVTIPLTGIINVSVALFLSLIVIELVFIFTAWRRDIADSHQQDEIGSLRGRLEERIEERTRYTRIAADIAQEILSASSMDEILNQAASLIISRLKFSYAGIFITDEIGQHATLKAAQGSGAGLMVRTGKRVTFDTSSLLGWVAQNKQQRVASRVIEDSLHLETELLPENQSEIGVPVLSKDQLLGILDVQSTRSTVFDNETIIVLEMISSQIATAILNIRRTEVEQGSTKVVAELNLARTKIIQAKTEDDIHKILQALFSKLPYITMLLTPEGEDIKIALRSDFQLPDEQPLPETISVSITDRKIFLNNDLFTGEGNRLNTLPYELVRLLKQLEVFSVALVPILRNEDPSAILLIGTRKKSPLGSTDIQPYSILAEEIGTSYVRIREAQMKERHIAEIDTINFQLKKINELASGISSTNQLEEALKATQRVFQQTSYGAILLISENNKFRIATSVDPLKGEKLAGLPDWLDVSPADLQEQIGSKSIVADVEKLLSLYYAQFHPELNKFIEAEAEKLPSINSTLLKTLEQAQFRTVAFIPVMRKEELAALLIFGRQDEQAILSETVQVFTSVADLITSSTERIEAANKKERHITEIETINNVGQEISIIRDLNTIYATLHSRIRQLLGNFSFLVALYNQNTSSISVPYMYENGPEGGIVTSIDTFPFGEGLASIVIRTKQPLMLLEDSERQAAALGAKITGKPAKSWLGTPLIVSGEAIGALVVQDPEHEFAFNENDMRLLSSLSTQVAGAIYNARLLEQMQARAVQLQTAAEVARDISGSLDLGELLGKAITLIYERFNFYHAAIFMLDTNNEFAVIREATGEAGMQMKRAEHKLKVGSKSIVGFVTGSGEPLIVNDTSRDATYYANPLLPDTHAEVAIPLRVGQRILGALDVQSTRAFSFGEEDVRILRVLADQMAIAVINSELFADTQEHLSQHRLLHHVTTAAASGTTLEESLNSATQGLQVTLGGARVSILLADQGKKTLKVRAYAGYSEEVGKLEIPFGEGVTGWVAVHQQPQRINDVTQDPRYLQVGSNIRSELAIPLSYRGDLLGVLNVESDQVGAYNENDEELLGTLGGSLAAIISNARLIEQVRRQIDHERMLYEVTSKIRRSTDMQTIMATTAGELSKVLGARRAQIKMGTIEPAPESKKSVNEIVSSSGDSE